MGTVYKARDRVSGAFVAMKIVPPQITKNTVLMKRFEQEYNVAKTLDHPNIVRALDFGMEGTVPYLVMEFVGWRVPIGERGWAKGLDDSWRKAEAASGSSVRWLQACRRHMVRGMVHRDVKPDNILLTREGQAKLADLGLVKELETDLNLTRTGRGLGTPYFMAPEQFRNAKHADARCDIYSMAASLYMMVTGELPYKSLGPLDAWMKKISNDIAAPRELVPGLSERVDWAIRRAMCADPSLRPANCREFVEDLTGHSTRKLIPIDPGAAQDLWYLFFVDDEGVKNTVKGTLTGIRRSLKEGLLGDASNVRACRQKQGLFEPLRVHPEFRDLVISPTSTPVPGFKTPPTALPIPENPPPPTAKAAKAGSSERLAMAPALPLPAAAGPLIDLGQPTSSASWVGWLVILVLIAVVAGVVGYFAVPMVLHR